MPGTRDPMQIAFPDLPYEDDPADLPKPDPNKALLDQIAALNAEVTNLKRAPLAMAQDFSIQQRPNLPIMPDVKNLPDPVLEPEAYASQMAQRISQADQNRRQLEDFDRQQMERQRNRVDTLWTDFETSYPDLAKKKKAVEFIAEQVANEAAARGLDPQRYMFGNRTQFMADVANRYKQEFGTPTAPSDDEGGEDTRTEMLGARSTGGRTSGDEETTRRESDGFKSIRDWQIKTGFHG